MAASAPRGAGRRHRILSLGRALDRDGRLGFHHDRRVLRPQGRRIGRGDQGIDRDPGPPCRRQRRRRHHFQGLPRRNRLSQNERRLLGLPVFDGDAQARNRESFQALPAGRSGGGGVRGLKPPRPPRGCQMFYRWLFTSHFMVMWAGWAAIWIAMARGVKQPAQSESAASRLSHVGPLLVAAYLLAAPAPLPVPALHGRVVPLATWPPAIGAALGFAGLAFCVWARVTIAANWSSDVQLKRGHELIVA